MSIQQSSTFWVDTNPKAVKWGIEMKPLLITEHTLFIGKQARFWGAFQYLLNPRIWLFALISTLTGSPIPSAVHGTVNKPYTDENNVQLSGQYDCIHFSTIQKIILRKLITLDWVITIVYLSHGNEKTLSMFVVNEFNSINYETHRLYLMLANKWQAEFEKLDKQLLPQLKHR